jgi:hypothetical protein
MDIFIAVAQEIYIGILSVKLLVSNVVGAGNEVAAQFFVEEFGYGKVHHILGFLQIENITVLRIDAHLYR